ncbi:MAG: hypothetical protein ABEJ28_12550, partial [Salinigranum sp.]
MTSHDGTTNVGVYATPPESTKDHLRSAATDRILRFVRRQLRPTTASTVPKSALDRLSTSPDPYSS